ncbi:carboxylic ester hydrolase [Favolaschia claudopus]|uniref:Carboxylic ester hydrolase n=1 Tax=Favolaschia claudopus TaxID=2862362 RepID=A0AAW0C1G5_9AGAR
MLSLLSLQLCLPLLMVAGAPTAPTVSLPYGTFEGFNSGNLTQFLGLPFAQAGRFEYPREPSTFSGVQKAIKYGPACPQQHESTPPGEPFKQNTYAVVSEDCLTLDIFRPTGVDSTTKLPVLVWLYGGGWEVGDSRDFNLTPAVERSIQIGEPFVAVTINYRLSVFGWLMGKEAAAAGLNNLGMRDQIFALEWVERYIHLFSGDPKRVTLGGQSAGSISAAFLTMDNAQNSNTLFRGVWLESGPPNHIPRQTDDQSIYDFVVSSTNCADADDTIECLQHVPYDTLMTAVNNTADFLAYRSLNLVWTPRIDGELILKSPWLAVQEGAYAKIPIVGGVCEDEGTIFALSSLNITTDAEFLGYVHSNFFPETSSDELAEIARLYPSDPAQGSPFNTGTQFQVSPEYKRVAAFIGDMAMVSPLRFLAEHASSRQDVWTWLVEANQAAGGAVGAYHLSDIPIWLTTTTSLGTQGMDALVNFVNTLDPNQHLTQGSSATVWPKHNTPSAGGNSSLIVFADDGVRVAADNYRQEGMDYLNSLRLKEASMD